MWWPYSSLQHHKQVSGRLWRWRKFDRGEHGRVWRHRWPGVIRRHQCSAEAVDEELSICRKICLVSRGEIGSRALEHRRQRRCLCSDGTRGSYGLAVSLLKGQPSPILFERVGIAAVSLEQIFKLGNHGTLRRKGTLHHVFGCRLPCTPVADQPYPELAWSRAWLVKLRSRCLKCPLVRQCPSRYLRLLREGFGELGNVEVRLCQLRRELEPLRCVSRRLVLHPLPRLSELAP
mmetsp:Transcript_35732/g.93413  ORF Transcript_35732/g.93413 Transcript_35732/m.93413 type:complete len:233 (-) Transcript_35732:573-1271(-)